MPPFITLTTDFGTRDYYAALVKGAILSATVGTDTPVQIIDVTHEIPPYDIVAAAFAVKHVYTSFPKGTIHIVAVDSFYGGHLRFVAARAEGYFFLAPDNGVLSLILERDADELAILELPNPATAFPIKDVLANAIRHLCTSPELRLFAEIGMPVNDIVRRISIQPVVRHDSIRGVVTHIDNYQNAITNIHRTTVERVAHGRVSSLYFKRHSPIVGIHHYYSDVAIGEMLCLFNSAGFLEIAIHLDKAAMLLELAPDDPVQLIFDGGVGQGALFNDKRMN